MPALSSVSLPWKKCVGVRHFQQQRRFLEASRPRPHRIDRYQFVPVAHDDQPRAFRPCSQVPHEPANRWRDRDQPQRLSLARTPVARRPHRMKTRPATRRRSENSRRAQVNHGQRVRDFADPVVIASCAGAHTAEIETHRGGPGLLHRTCGRVNDLVLHRAGVQRVRMADHTHGLARCARRHAGPRRVLRERRPARRSTIARGVGGRKAPGVAGSYDESDTVFTSKERIRECARSLTAGYGAMAESMQTGQGSIRRAVDVLEFRPRPAHPGSVRFLRARSGAARRA